MKYTKNILGSFFATLILFAFVLSPVFAVPTTETITESSLSVPATPTTIQNSWYFYNDNTNTASILEVPGDYEFVNGIDNPPSGNGSIKFNTNTGERWNIASNQFAGLNLGDITNIQFTIYRPSTSTGSETLFFNFDVDFDNTSTTGYQGRLVYVPTDNGTLTPDSWQTFDMDSGMWRWSRFESNGNKWPDNDLDPLRTWSEIKSAFPNIEIWNENGIGGQVLVRAGHPGPEGLVGYVDSVVVNETTYDFEMYVAPSVPAITSPLNGAIVATSALTEIDWSDSTPGTYTPVEYQYQAFSDAGYTNLVYSSTWLNASEIPTPGAPVGDYYLQVRARDAQGNMTAWSNDAGDTYKITVVADPTPTPTMTPTPTPDPYAVPLACSATGNTYGAPIIGTEGSNKINGTAGNDLIFGLGGSDKIDGKGGNDCIVGGPGSNKIDGGGGNDVIIGGDDSDSLDGGSNDDKVYGMGGSDSLKGGSGNDELWGGNGDDALSGDGGNDTLRGEGGNDSAKGGSGNSDNCDAESEKQCEI